MSADFSPLEFVRTLAHRPGVYRMLDRDGRILYVGKARDLQRRVASYFGRKAQDAKTQALVKIIAGIEVTVTGTEQEALLLEYNLIKEHKPRFNVVLRDDKSYPYIHVTTDQDYPRFDFHRGARNQGGRYFGPFPGAGSVRLMLQQLQKLFRVRQCTDSFFSNRSRPCLQYQIHRCSGPCVGLVSKAEYQRDVDNAMRFIAGQGADVLADLVSRMEACSGNMEYERAAQYRDQIAEVRRVQEQQIIAGGADTDLDALAVADEHGQCCVAVLMIRGGRVLGSRTFFPRIVAGTMPGEVLSAFLSQHYLGQWTPPEILVTKMVDDAELLSHLLAERAGHGVSIRPVVRGKHRRWLEMARANARQAAASRAAATATLREQLAELTDAAGLPSAPERIECFDISHTQGGETVASCVVFGPSGALKSDYRRFNIRDVAPGDDYGALAQAVARRYGQAQPGERPLPDLILVDGGRGQLTRVCSVLEELGLQTIPILGIAKGEGRRAGYEKVYRPGRSQPLSWSEHGGAFRVIQQIRDEAHRFAITGHRQRRGRQQSRSVLDSIAGLGPSRRRALLQQFGGLQGITRAGVEDLARTEGISRGLAERIYGRLHDAPE